MIVLGLTGNIASGKSLVSKHLRELGAVIIDADHIARLIVEPGEPALEEIRTHFGDEAINRDGTLNREYVGNIVFSDHSKRQVLNRITHPRIVSKIRDFVDKQRHTGTEVAVIEAALIVEKGGLNDLIDKLVVVATDDTSQIKRLIERDDITEAEARRRIHSQMPAQEKIKHADYIIDNSHTPEHTKQQVLELWETLSSQS